MKYDGESMRGAMNVIGKKAFDEIEICHSQYHKKLNSLQTLNKSMSTPTTFL